MKTIPFEEAYARIQAIAEQMERPETTIDQSIELYKEAAQLLARCKEILSDAKITIREIKVDVDNEL